MRCRRATSLPECRPDRAGVRARVGGIRERNDGPCSTAQVNKDRSGKSARCRLHARMDRTLTATALGFVDLVLLTACKLGIEADRANGSFGRHGSTNGTC